MSSSISIDAITAIAWGFGAPAIAVQITRTVLAFRARQYFSLEALATGLSSKFLIGFLTTWVVLAGLIKTLLEYEASDGKTEPPNVKEYLKLVVTLNALCASAMTAAKAAFLLSYRRLYRNSPYTPWTWWIVSAFLFISFWACFAAALVMCGGSASDIGNAQVCATSFSETVDKATSAYGYALDVGTSLAIMLLPMNQLRRLALPNIEKLGIGALVTLNLVVIALATYQVAAKLESTTNYVVILATLVEASLAVLMASALGCWLLVRHGKSSSDLKETLAHRDPLAVSASKAARDSDLTSLSSQQISMEFLDVKTEEEAQPRHFV